MVYFSHALIEQIKAADDEASVKAVIQTSLLDLPSKRRTGLKRSFILNMIMALKYARAEGLSTRETVNVSRAIEILEKLRRLEHENLF